MALSLHFHPLSSFCHKALIALNELDIDVERRFLDLGDPAQRTAFLARWPTGKMPLLVDGDRVVPETSVIIEYLAKRYGRPDQQLVPTDEDAALEVRLMDRLLDLYVMLPMQAIVGDRLRAEADRDPIAVNKARDTLAMAYGMLDERIADRAWAAGEHFSMADCAAAPSLFYAATLVPFAPSQRRLAGYFERLMQRPSVVRTSSSIRIGRRCQWRIARRSTDRPQPPLPCGMSRNRDRRHAAPAAIPRSTATPVRRSPPAPCCRERARPLHDCATASASVPPAPPAHTPRAAARDNSPAAWP
jgi:glutathione S-transferase